MVHTGEMKNQRQSLQRITFGTSDITSFLHLFQYRITASACTFILTLRIKIRRVLTHTDQSSSFLYLQILRSSPEINPSSRLDSYRIIQEVKLIQIHINDLFLCIITFQLNSNHPFNRLLEKTFHQIICIR